jgi:hypothetical protein
MLPPDTITKTVATNFKKSRNGKKRVKDIVTKEKMPKKTT